MARQGLGIPDEEPAAGLPNFGGAPPPDDVHDISTTVAELPPQLLESLKVPAPCTPAGIDASPRPEPAPAWEPAADLIDLTDSLDADEPMTVQLDTVMLDMAALPPIAELTADEAPPRTIELHVIRESGALGAVENELARLPRRWLIAGALVASVVIAAALMLLGWSLIRLAL